MAPSEALAIERLGAGDVAAGLTLSDAAGWNQTGDDWAFFLARGQAIGVRNEAGTLVASAVALPYDAAIGWISMVLVDAAHRHRGIASQLVAACVASLRQGGRTPVLDATPAGAAVYARSGFVAGFGFERWEGPGDGAGGDAVSRADGGEPAGAAASLPNDVRASLAGAVDAETLIALDRAASGVDRAPLWRAFVARGDTRAWLARDGDGFVVRRGGRRATQIGPVVAADAEQAQALVAAALADVAGRAFIDVPTHCEPLGRWLAGRGFVRQRPFVRMALGDARAAAGRARVFAVAGPEFG